MHTLLLMHSHILRLCFTYISAPQLSPLHEPLTKFTVHPRKKPAQPSSNSFQIKRCAVTARVGNSLRESLLSLPSRLLSLRLSLLWPLSSSPCVSIFFHFSCRHTIHGKLNSCVGHHWKCFGLKSKVISLIQHPTAAKAHHGPSNLNKTSFEIISGDHEGALQCESVAVFAVHFVNPGPITAVISHFYLFLSLPVSQPIQVALSKAPRPPSPQAAAPQQRQLGT